jgi:hypothetical protein
MLFGEFISISFHVLSFLPSGFFLLSFKLCEQFHVICLLDKTHYGSYN